MTTPTRKDECCLKGLKCSTLPFIILYTFLHFYVHIMNISKYKSEQLIIGAKNSSDNVKNDNYQGFLKDEIVEIETFCLLVDLSLPLLGYHKFNFDVRNNRSSTFAAFFGQNFLLFLAFITR